MSVGTTKACRCLLLQRAETVVHIAFVPTLLGGTRRSIRNVSDRDLDTGALNGLEVEICVISRTCARPVSDVQVRRS
jgi:hypothetical protein